MDATPSIATSTGHAAVRSAEQHQCRDCEFWWGSKAAADECAILDAVEAKQARREKR